MNKSEYKKMLKNSNIFDADILSDYIYNSNDGIFVADRYGKLILANESITDMIGVSYDELLGHTIKDIIKRGFYEGSPSTEAARTGKTNTGLVKTRSGVEILSTSTPVYDENGELQYVVTNCRPLHVIKKFLDKYLRKESNLSNIKYDTEDHDSKYMYTGKAMKEILSKCAYAAKTNCSIMLIGQTGTGKGVMAQYIHNNSTRAKEKYLEINCAALPENLLESELFGYEKGAFTGASNFGKQGLFEIANKGTIFLDEIGELSLQLQAKLLKVLDSGYLLRVGGTVYHKINVRIISATNRDLHKMMKEGDFREDLFYRLNVIKVKIPALKDRKDEIKDIIEYLLEKTNNQYSTKKKLTDDAYTLLLDYDWPGNIRQLDNFIQRAVVLSMNENKLNKKMISSFIDEEIDIDTNIEEGYSNQVETLKSYIDRIEVDYIEKAIIASGGSVTKAADKLGIHRTAVYQKLKRKNEDID